LLNFTFAVTIYFVYKQKIRYDAHTATDVPVTVAVPATVASTLPSAQLFSDYLGKTNSDNSV